MKALRFDPWLLLAAAAALASLPIRVFPPDLLLWFAVPGLLFALLALPPFAAALRFELRVGLALATQIALTAILVTRVVPLPVHHALTLNLIAPLVYLTLRRRPGSLRLALFLALCILWIGLMADRDPGFLRPALFAAAGALALQREARREATQVRGLQRFSLARPLRVHAGAVLIALATLCVVLGLLPLLRMLKPPSGARPQRTVGVSSEFQLDQADAGPLRMTGDQLLLVEPRSRELVPDDLYLRCAAFEVAALDEWSPGDANFELVREDPLYLPDAGGDGQRLAISHLDLTGDLVFLPIGASALRGVAPIQVDYRRGLLRAAPRNGVDRFEAEWSPQAFTLRDRIDLRDASGLLALPASMRGGRFVALLEELGGPARRADLRTAVRIARGLQQRCSYQLTEPTGPYQHALENFLFGDRTGYCMHFASAYALLLRLQGIPCRIGVGLYGGAPDVDLPRARLFGSRHAHAWVEIPLHYHGFTVFDPTPAAQLAPEESRWPEARLGTGTTETSDWAGFDAVLAPIGALLGEAWPWLAVLALLVLARAGPRLRRRGLTRISVEMASARRLLERLLRELARQGHRRDPTHTLEAFARTLPVPLREQVAPAFTAYQEVRFGAHSLDEPRVQRLERGLAAAAAIHRATANG